LWTACKREELGGRMDEHVLSPVFHVLFGDAI